MARRDEKKPKPRGQSFGSFQELAKALGGGEESDAPSDEPPEEPGWTLKRAGEDQEIDLEAIVDTTRPRRPPAFGPMEHGPKPYRNVDSEEMQLLKSFRIRTTFPDDVQDQVAKLPEDPTEEDFVGRLDLRDELIFTIDGEDAKDYDDAISMETLDNGNVELGVHIADVGHYVTPETPLDDEAQERGTSIYVADQVIPMLPEKLSNHLCSLVPNRDRLAYSVFMEFTPEGKRVGSRVAKSVIRSKYRCTYRLVQELLDGKTTEETAKIAHLEDTLRLLTRWTRTQQLLRDQAGSLRMQSVEKKFVFNEAHEVTAIVNATNYFSQTLIEETALAANQAVGDFFRNRGLPTIYRVHPEKDPEEVQGVIEMLEKYKVRVPMKDRLTGRDIGNLVRAVRGRPNSEALIQRIMGLVERADYQVKDHEDVAKHWGLAREAYLHFTSPIRRYPDLIVHRWLHAVQSRPEEAERHLLEGALVDDLNMKASHSTLQASLAEMAERAVFDLKVCQYMDPHIGETHVAKIMRVSRGGLDIILDAFNVTGFLPYRKIGGRAEVTGPTVVIRAGKRHYSFTEGGDIRITIADVDFVRLQVLLELA
ncbi:MAG: RNB domain-containing ribonuclease [Planctomycetes bacterium]|nr:RNB domain-containing ribonuclease [Planctomycetota bacterium]